MTFIRLFPVATTWTHPDISEKFWVWYTRKLTINFPAMSMLYALSLKSTVPTGLGVRKSQYYHHQLTDLEQTADRLTFSFLSHPAVTNIPPF